MSDVTSDAKRFEGSLQGNTGNASDKLIQDVQRNTTGMNEEQRKTYREAYSEKLVENGVLPRISDDWLNSEFDKVDSNKDGKIQEKELQDAKNGRTDAEIMMLDNLAKRYSELKNQHKKDNSTGNENDGEVTRGDVEAQALANRLDVKRADDKVTAITLPDGVRIVKKDDGWYEADEKGNPTAKKSEVTSVVVDDRGTIHITKNGKSDAPDQLDNANDKSSKLEIRADGTEIEKNKDGNVIRVKIPGQGEIRWDQNAKGVNGEKGAWVDAEGKATDVKDVSVSSEGVITVTRHDLIKVEYFPDGTSVEKRTVSQDKETMVRKDKDGDVIEVKVFDESGKPIELKWDPNTKSWNPPDVKHVQQDKDGTIRVIHRDGSYEEYKPDGTIEKKGPGSYQSIDADQTKEGKALTIEVRRGEGYYQSAARYFEEMGIKASPKEILALARYMRDVLFGKNTVLKQGDHLITAENMKKIRDMAERIRNKKTNV